MSSGQIRGLIEMLFKEQLITEQQQTQFLDHNFSDLSTAGKFIKREVYIAPEKWAQLVGKVLSMPYVNLVGKTMTGAVLNTLPADLAENYQIVVYEKTGDTIKVGMVDPSNFKAMEAIEFIARKAGLKTEYSIISNESFRAAVKQYESLGEEVGEALGVAEELFAPKGELEDLQPGSPVDDVIKSALIARLTSTASTMATRPR